MAASSSTMNAELWACILSYLPLHALVTARQVNHMLQTASQSQLIAGHCVTLYTSQQRNSLTHAITAAPDTVECLTKLTYEAWADEGDSEDAQREDIFWRTLAAATGNARQPIITSLQLNRNCDNTARPRLSAWQAILSVPNLHSLMALSSSGTPCWPWSKQSLDYDGWAHKSSSLLTLQIVLVDDVPSQQLINVLHKLPQLMTLTIDEDHSRPFLYGVTDYTLLAQCQSLRHLTLDTYDGRVAPTLLPAISQLPLSTLHVGYTRNADWPSWCENATAMHETLVSFTCKFKAEPTTNKLIGLHHFHELRCLRLSAAQLEHADFSHISRLLQLTELEVTTLDKFSTVPVVEMLTQQTGLCQRLESLTLSACYCRQTARFEQACPNLQLFNGQRIAKRR